jgi:hypothetical protein
VILDGGDWERAISVAGFIAGRYAHPTNLNARERFAAAFDRIVAYVSEHGWPEDTQLLFNAGSAGIAAEKSLYKRHMDNWSYWHPVPTGLDAVGERITDRIAVWQAVWALKDHEWAAVWAYAQVMTEVENEQQITQRAAALLDVSVVVYKSRLHEARKKIYALWGIPGETPRGKYMPRRNGKRTKYEEWLETRRRATRRYQAELDAPPADPARLADVFELSAMTNGAVPVSVVRNWAIAAHLPKRGVTPKGLNAYSIDEFIALCVKKNRLGPKPDGKGKAAA